ncbi:DNS2B protein, partial [Amia calva]|nr:DNS2B protein [Amia calva]
MYLDSVAKEWQLSGFLVNTSQGALGKTLGQLYERQEYKSNSSAYMLYNDAPPLLDYMKYHGHTKGVLHFDQFQGFWLSHTVPHFPPFPEKGYGWPSTAMRNGQTAFCVTYKYGQFAQIAEQLLSYNPRVYNCSLPEVFQHELPSLACICEGSKMPWVPGKRVKKLVSAGGESFLSLAKSSYFVDGVVMLDRQTGVWLTHSTPQFPGKTRRSFWPSSGKSNGQTFFCGTYKYSNFSDIAIQLQYIHIYTFDFHVPTTFHDGLRCVAQRTCYPRKAPWFKRLEMKSLAGNTFISFAKYSRFQDDLYSGLLVDYLGDDIYSKSWGKLRRPLPSNCSGSHKVYNVQEMQLPQTQPFGTAVDHSKWCVTDSDGQPWTCIADMNREESQSKRGGGAVCTNDTGVWEAFRKIVNTYENCRHVEL